MKKPIITVALLLFVGVSILVAVADVSALFERLVFNAFADTRYVGTENPIEKNLITDKTHLAFGGIVQ